MSAFIFLIPAAYLLGSIPFGLLLARMHGIDLRKVGSGNIGATNVSRALGKKWAYICFGLDVAKGLLPMLMPIWLGKTTPPVATATLWLWLLTGCAAIIGHIFPVWLGFKGGKGVATSLGVVLGLWPYYTLPGVAAFVVWAIAVKIWRYVSLASIMAAVIFPLALAAGIAALRSWTCSELYPLLVFAVLMPMLVIGRHVENIKRLLEGSENKISTKHGDR